MTTKSIRIMIQIEWPSEVVDRRWDGSGPFVDGDGHVWHGCNLPDGLDEIEQVINGEAYVLNLSLMNVGATEADLHWDSIDEGHVIGGVVRIMIQPCDENDQPIGDREVMFTGRVDNVVFEDVVVDDRVVSKITAEIANRFHLRRLNAIGGRPCRTPTSARGRRRSILWRSRTGSASAFRCCRTRP